VQLPITLRASKLLDVLKKNGGWMSRAQIAHETGKRVLSPHDKELLERLIQVGLVEKHQRESNTPVGIAFEYRAVIEKGETM
jgi:predicted transcriptional regulator